MATSTGSSTKLCVSCGKNVAGGKRMKDSSGRYWCIECGTEDQKKKSAAGANGIGGALCSGCGESFPASQLSKWGTSMLCNKCVARRSKGPGLMERLKSMVPTGGSGGRRSSGEGMSVQKIAMIVGVLGAMAAVAIYVNFFSK